MKLNLASGQRPFPKPWVNIDIRDQGYPIDIVADIRRLDMVADGMVEIAIAHHVLEHFDMSEIGNVAREWHRILRPGGKLAIFVPNNKAIAQRYLDGQIDDFTFNVNMYGAYQGHPGDLHRWSYHADYLDQQMKRSELWSDVREITPDVLRKPVYEGSDCALDWWILAREYTK